MRRIAFGLVTADLCTNVPLYGLAAGLLQVRRVPSDACTLTGSAVRGSWRHAALSVCLRGWRS